MAGRRQIEAGKAVVTLSLRDRLSAGLSKVGRRINTFGRDLVAVGAKTTAFAAAVGAPLVAAAKNFASIGDTLDKMSQRTGVSTNALSELGFAAEQSGADLETVEKGVRSMQRSVTDLGRGLTTQKAAFDRLGLTYAEVGRLSPDEQFALIAERLSLIENESIRAATSMQIFGRSGSALLPLLNQGADGIQQLREQARGLGLSIDPESAKAAAELTDQANILSRVLKNTLFRAGQSLAPLFTDLARRAQSGAAGFREFVTENGRLLIGLTKLSGVLVAVGTAVTAFGTLALGIGGVVALASPLVTGLLGVAAALGAASLATVGFVASLNDGKVAGFDFGRFILQLADDLNVYKSAALAAERAEKGFAEAAQDAASAMERLNKATDPREKVRAADALVAALQKEVRAREELNNVAGDTSANDREALRARSVALQRARSNVELSRSQNNGRASNEALAALRAEEEAFARLRQGISVGTSDPILNGLRQQLSEATEQADSLRVSLADAALADNGSIQALEAKVSGLNAEAAALSEQLAEVRNGANLDGAAVVELAERLKDVQTRAKVAAGELATLKQQAADALVPNYEPSVFEKLAVRLREAFQEQTHNARQAVELDYRIKMLGATDAERSILTVTKEADELRRSLRDLGRLTPKIDADIANRTNRALEQALEVKVGPETFNFGRNAVVDSRSIQSLQGGVVDYQQRTAKATEAMEKEIRRLAESGVLRYGG